MRLGFERKFEKLPTLLIIGEMDMCKTRILFLLSFLLVSMIAVRAQTKSVTGTVVSHSTGASGNFSVIELRVGSKNYEVYLFRKDVPSPRIVGTVDEAGRVVRIYYTRIVRSQGYDGELRATRIVEVKKSKK